MRVVYQLFLRGQSEPITVLPSGPEGESTLLAQLRSDANEMHFGRGGPGTCGVFRSELAGYRAVEIDESEVEP